MTTKEIAQATGKDASTVQRWIKKMNGKMQSIDSKMQSSNSTNPADFNLEETILIIEYGMGKNAAALYRMSAKDEPRQNVPQPRQNVEAITKADIAGIVSITVSETIKQLLPFIQGNNIKLPEPDKPALPPIEPRKELNMIAKEAGYVMGSYSEPWNQIYKNAYYRIGINFRERAKNRGMEPLEYADAEGYTPQLLAIAREIFR